MDHPEAVRNMAVERYLLGEMPEAERLAFEEHYFDCPECAAGVEAGVTLAANARAVFAEEAAPRPAPVPSWSWAAWKWPAVAFAALLILVVAAEELVRIPRIRAELAGLRSARSYPAFFLHPVVRGDDKTLEVGRTAEFVGLSFDVPPGHAAPAFDCRLEDASGRVRWTVPAPAPASPGEPVNLLVPAPDIPAGSYTLILSASGHEIQRFQFKLQYK